jgi:hypothetical protein
MSILEGIVDKVSNHHDLIPGIDTNKRQRRDDDDRCGLASGIEYSFVGLFCEEIIRRLPEQILPPYHQIFFIPNLKAEAKVGYDLSIGYYSQHQRVRTMHKVLNERWCDKRWTYRFNYERARNERYKGDYGHFIALLDPPREDLERPDVQVFPYLVINVCHCIHDYRRMGLVDQDTRLEIPSFDSLLRTIIVDLGSLKERIDALAIDALSDEFYLRVFRRPEQILPDEEPQNYMTRIANKNNLRIECSKHPIDHQNVILTFDEFFGRVDWVELLNTKQSIDA